MDKSNIKSYKQKILTGKRTYVIRMYEDVVSDYRVYRIEWCESINGSFGWELGKSDEYNKQFEFSDFADVISFIKKLDADDIHG
jgi:hypothetical protein